MKNNIEHNHRTLPYNYEEEKERVHSLSYDKRVKHIEQCDICGATLSRNRYNVNQGLCDNCLASIN